MRRSEQSDYQASSSESNRSSIQNSQCIKQQKKMKMKQKKERIYKQKNHGSWSWIEEEKFVTFMRSQKLIFQDKQARRRHKIFRKMSKFMGTRSSEQCRSHHQKYELKFGNFQAIVNHISSKLEEDQIRNTPSMPKNNESIRLQSPFQFNSVNKNDQFMFMPHIIMGQIPKNQMKKAKETKAVHDSQIIDSGKGYQIARSKQKESEILISLNLPIFFG